MNGINITIADERLARLAPYAYRPEEDPRQRDVFATIYAAASLFTLGYNLIRPKPNAWDSSLGDTATRIAQISSTVNHLMGLIADIQMAIAQLPAIINGIMEKQQALSALRKANATTRVLTPYMKSSNILMANVDEVNDLANDIMVDLELFSEWYDQHDTGPLSYLVSVAPASSIAMLAINYSQLMKWQIRNPQHIGPYPFEKGEILTHLDFGITSKVVQAYEKVVDGVQQQMKAFGDDAQAMFPWGKLSAEDFAESPTTHLYRFDGKNFSKCDFTTKQSSIRRMVEFPPKFFYDEIYFGSWVEPKPPQVPNVTVFLGSTQYVGSSATMKDSTCFGVPTPWPTTSSNPEKYRLAWERATAIATATHGMSKLAAIAPEIEKHRTNLDIIRNSPAWRIDV